jgi:methylglyoxal synthase
MNIALMAHDGKKELMVQFCIAYCGILAEHTIIATNTTGKLVSEATGLPIALYMGEAQGGIQQIGARIAYNEIDLVASVNEIARLCDMHNVPFASNAATAEVLVQGLRRGDFAWRDIVNPKNRKK